MIIPTGDPAHLQPAVVNDDRLRRRHQRHGRRHRHDDPRGAGAADQRRLRGRRRPARPAQLPGQELPAIEGLARVDVVCLDKTGTLTEGGMDVDRACGRCGDAAARRGTALGALAAADPGRTPRCKAISGEPTPTAPGWQPHGDRALLVRPQVERRRLRRRTATWLLGAPEVLLAAGDRRLRRRPTELAAERGRGCCCCARTAATCRADRRSTGAARPRWSSWNSGSAPTPPTTLRYFAEQGVTVKVISGDNPPPCRRRRRLGLESPAPTHAVDARTLPDDDPDRLAELLDAHTVFGRVTPQQKRAMVGALQARGHTVAMTGDGVNDVLALKDADIGVAMGSGSPATRAVAQLVLLDNRFATLPHVVGEGRRVIANIERVASLFLTKTVYAIVLRWPPASLGMPFPFLPRHSTLVNALTIGIPAFFLALAPAMDRARAGFVPRVLRLAVPAGVICAVAVLLAYGAARSGSLEQDRTSAVLALFLTTWWVLVLIARPLNRWRIALVGAMAALFAAALALPFVRDLFALRTGDPADGLTAVGISVVAAAAISIAVRLAGTLRP